MWSKINRERAERLLAAGMVVAAGVKEIEEAKADGRWDAAYDAPSQMEVPQYLLEALSKNEKAQAFYDTLNKANRYAVAFKLHHAKKEETKRRWVEKYIAMFERGESIH